MIDISSHILPGLDDGPSTLTESIIMAKQAAKLGINKIVATPHHRNTRYINKPEDIIAAVDYLNEKIQEEKIPVKILPGQKTTIYSNIIQDIKDGEMLSINNETKYLTLKLPPEQVSNNLERIVFEVQMAGYIPIISNPETHPGIHENPNLLYRAVKNGAVCSIATASIAGIYGKKIQKLAEKLLNAQLIHFIGSNAHNSTKRGFYFEEAIAFLNKNYSGVSYQLIRNNDALILGDPISKNEPSRIESKKWLIFGK